MTITITELQGLSFDNSVSDPRINPSSIPDSNWVISTLTLSPAKIRIRFFRILPEV